MIPDEPKTLSGASLVLGGIALAISNFLVVLDTTIANVSVPHIAGSMAVSANEGTYVITSYAVAEAIAVPLTGWLAARFGTVRTFTTALAMFGVCSLFCGLAPNLGALVFARIMQGFVGGPLMPLSQTMLMRIFPKEKLGAAIGLWSMTTLVAPILGPLTGGFICDTWDWPFIFFINVPLATLLGFIGWRILYPFETSLSKKPIDYIGLILLIIWVGALQIMLDEGKKFDWFASPYIVALLVVSIIGFAAFMIWELTDDHPIVDVRVFRHGGFTASVLTLSLAFGAFFSSVVLLPLWLQSYMGYTATWSGRVSALIGICAVFVAPIAAKLSMKLDARPLVSFGLVWIGTVTLYRSFGTTDMTYAQIAIPLLFQGIGMPFFFVPLTGLALASVKPEETASAAGLMSFLRTVAGAFATSIITTAWDNDAALYRTNLIAAASPENIATLSGTNTVTPLAAAQFNQMLQSQAIMLATNHIFQVVALCFYLAAAVIWLSPKAARKADTSAAH